MNRLASCLVGVGLLALALSGCAAVSATGAAPAAATLVGQVPQPPWEEPAPAEEILDEGATVPEDAFWQANQAPLGTATAAIEAQFPEEFAYAFFDDTSAMHVAFDGLAPVEAVALLKGTGLAHVVIESVGFNAAEYQAAAHSVVAQTDKYVTPERQVSVSQDPTIAPGAIMLSFQTTESRLTSNPGLASITVDAPFKLFFDFTNTSPLEFVTYD